MLLFRDQNHLTDETQEAFASRLGEPVPHPTGAGPRGQQLPARARPCTEDEPTAGTPTSPSRPDYPKASILRAARTRAQRRPTAATTGLGQHDRGLRPPAGRAESAWSTTSGPCTPTPTTIRGRPHSYVSQEAIEKHRNVLASTVYDDGASRRAHPSGDRRADPDPGALHQVRSSASSPGTAASCSRSCSDARHAAREHGPLALARGRRGHLGQPRHPALRGRRLRRDQHRVMRRVTLRGDVPGPRSRRRAQPGR